jgi:hypothetical protein
MSDMKIFKHIMVFLLLATAASCGDFYEMEEQAPEVNLGSIKIERRDLTIMEGEQFVMGVKTEVADSLLGGFFWQSLDTTVVRFSGDTVRAVKAGTAKVKVTSVKGQLTDSISVTVEERWLMDNVSPYLFARDMVVYADVTVKGQKASDNLIIAAFTDGELRGIGERKEAYGRQYVQIRVYNANAVGEDAPYNYQPSEPEATDDDEEVDDDDQAAEDDVTYDEVTFRCYDRSAARFYDFPTVLYFDGRTHGTLSNLLKLTIE